VSIFAGTIGEAFQVLDIAQGFDEEDAYSRSASADAGAMPVAFRSGVPAEPLEFFGDDDAAALYAQSIDDLRALGGTAVAVAFAPFRDAARLLYQGPWVAERLAALRQYDFERPDAIHPVVWQIIGGARDITALEGFTAFHELARFTRAAEAEWAKMDVLLLPTTGTTYTIDAVLADPAALNSNLGLYTNFVNLMDLSAIAVPAGFRPNGLPFGVTLIGRAFEDRKIANLADQLHRSLVDAKVGGTGLPLPSAVLPSPKPSRVQVAVVGAHLTGQPLNWQLTDRRAALVRTARTAPGYSLYVLAGTVPVKPALIFDNAGQGLIEVEIWEMDFAAFGSFVAEIPPPLGIGTVTLDDGRTVKCFLGEAYAVADAEDITVFGGWRNWLIARSSFPKI
jgi:allophanate hydrolase